VHDARRTVTTSLAVLPRENVFGHTAKLRFFLEAIENLRTERGRGLRILDLGCGSGWAVTRHLGKTGDKVLGIDLHAPNIRYAQQHYAGDVLEFRCADVRTLEAETGKWDAIVLADVLEHLNDPEEVLARCNGMLAPGGRVLVALPNGFGPFEIESALARVPVLGPVLLRATDLLVALLNKFVLRGLWTRTLQQVPAGIPYNDDSPHMQFRSHGGWTSLFHHASFHVARQRNLTFLAGPFTNYLLGCSVTWCEFNARLGRRLPKSLVSCWAFELIPAPTAGQATQPGVVPARLRSL
jgi:2-polyprenyl-3-methyl-5-hydroxy-6-metoxy-1,4-benzoquinol methylase